MGGWLACVWGVSENHPMTKKKTPQTLNHQIEPDSFNTKIWTRTFDPRFFELKGLKPKRAPNNFEPTICTQQLRPECLKTGVSKLTFGSENETRQFEPDIWDPQKRKKKTEPDILTPNGQIIDFVSEIKRAYV